MKTLYLIRHAKSSWKHPELSDLDRPLNKRGKQDAPEMGKRLAAQGVKPDLVISSPAKRALTTARMICEEVEYEHEIHVDERVYAASTSELIQVIHEIDESCSIALLFGHNPEFTNLAELLTPVRIDNIPTCGVFCMQFDENWADVDHGRGRFISFDCPKNI